jgi:pimeloyl-ACP methyl ester carboxylesterase
MPPRFTRRPTAVAALAILALAAGSFRALAQQPARGAERFVGNWLGALPTPAMRLRLALTISRDSAGALTGVLTSLDQGNATIPARITARGDTLVAVMPAARATYTAVLSTARDSLHGSFTQGAALPLDMARVATLPSMNRPQDPKPPFPYRATDVTVESVPGVRLAGTVLLPNGAGPFPAVVLVTGSGAQNRDEALLGHKPFLVIADYLARHGIASLRYDDRGYAKSTGNFAAGTSADFANDAEAAVQFLRSQPGIAPGGVGILGHSEGGMIAPMVAARDRDVGFIVMLSGPGVPGDSILLMQEALIAAASGARQATIDRMVEANRGLFDAIKAASDSADAVARMAATSQRIIARLPVAERALGETQLAQARAQLSSPWMRYFIAYDPRPALSHVRVPVLALGGTLDLQVPYKEDLAAIEAALKAGGNTDYRVVSMPGLNHLFQTAKTGAPDEYSSISETLSPAALDMIAQWINARFGVGKTK